MMNKELAANTPLSHYRIERKLGAGGMAEVYLAHDKRLQRPVALKLLPAAYTTDRNRLRRFEQEACAASALNHPNILTVYEIGVENDSHFIATEFVDGVTLRQKMREAPLRLQGCPSQPATDQARGWHARDHQLGQCQLPCQNMGAGGGRAAAMRCGDIQTLDGEHYTGSLHDAAGATQ